MKVGYISESLSSKKNGGSSLSGTDFLSMLRVKYPSVLVYTYKKTNLDDAYYGRRLHRCRCVLRKRKVSGFGFGWRAILKKLYFSLRNILASSCNESGDILFVNSWSDIYSQGGFSGYKHKVCVVRGSPESFIYQPIAPDIEESINMAADYLKEFDSLIFVSSIGMSDWLERFPELGDKQVYYLPNSIDEHSVDKVLAKLSRPEAPNADDPFIVTTVGSVQVRKAQDLLEEILPYVVEHIPNIRIQVVGNISRRWGGQEIKIRLERSRYSRYISFLGHSDDPYSIVRASHLALFLSRAEAFPRTVAEYMALEMPIVASSVSGVPELITDCRTGLLFDNESPQKAAENILWVYENYSASIILGRNAAADYRNRFSKNKQLKRALDIFDDID